MNNIQKLCEKHCDLEASTEKNELSRDGFFAYVTKGKTIL